MAKAIWILNLLSYIYCVLSRSYNPYVSFDFTTQWKKIAETRTLHPANLTAMEFVDEEEEDMFKIRIHVNKLGIRVTVDEQEVYEKVGTPSDLSPLRHSGIHLLVLHPLRGTVMLQRQFLTQQPAEDRNLAACLQGLAPGNILLVAAVPDAVMFLGPDAVFLLEQMGARRLRNLARHEAWAMVAHTPERPYTPMHFEYPVPTPSLRPQTTPLGRVWGESLVLRSSFMWTSSSPVDMEILVPKTPAVACDWHKDEAMRAQREFCDTYDGYIRLCKCHDPIHKTFRYSSENITIREIIPVAMLTAIKPFNFYRQLLNLLETPGASQTPILVLIDGYHREIVKLAKLFGLDVLIHRPQGEKGTATLLNMHFRFSVHNVFNFFPDADKAIILEDDLLLSPDFLSFFQQSSWLLDEDPTLTCINAFSINSFPDVAFDAKVLRRVELFPQFGWLVKRAWAQEVYEAWIPEWETADWDWWLFKEVPRKRRDALVPEVSRVIHSGSSGAHVTGYAQEHYFNHMFYNKDPHVKLEGLQELTKERYEEKIRLDLLRAVTLNLTKSPCDGPFLPEGETGPFKIFVEAKSKNDEYESYFVMQMCVHAYPEEAREIFRGIIRYNIHGRLLYVVGCPFSPYCLLFDQGFPLLRPSSWLVESALEASRKWQRRTYPPHFLERRAAAFPEEAFAMENLMYVSYNGTFLAKGKASSFGG